MKIIKFIFNIASWIAIGLIIMMVLYLITSSTEIFSGYRSFLVQSGSMEPTIMTGDIIVIHRQSNYVLRDVVTFKDADNRVVTHRIAEINQEDGTTKISTKGDANRSEDFDNITYDRILGKVVFVIPKLGYLVAFSKSLPGLIILIMIPAFMLIGDELFKVKKNNNNV